MFSGKQKAHIPTISSSPSSRFTVHEYEKGSLKKRNLLSNESSADFVTSIVTNEPFPVASTLILCSKA